jgi:uncharacterized Zn finger protein
MNEMPETDTLLSESNSLCSDSVCPNCGAEDSVTAELVLVGNAAVTLCHCRLCGHSWHPRLETDPV